jgi:hypothetical protein
MHLYCEIFTINITEWTLLILHLKKVLNIDIMAFLLILSNQCNDVIGHLVHENIFKIPSLISIEKLMLAVSVFVI